MTRMRRIGKRGRGRPRRSIHSPGSENRGGVSLMMRLHLRWLGQSVIRDLVPATDIGIRDTPRRSAPMTRGSRQHPTMQGDAEPATIVEPQRTAYGGVATIQPKDTRTQDEQLRGKFDVELASNCDL